MTTGQLFPAAAWVVTVIKMPSIVPKNNVGSFQMRGTKHILELLTKCPKEVRMWVQRNEELGE